VDIWGIYICVTQSYKTADVIDKTKHTIKLRELL